MVYDRFKVKDITEKNPYEMGRLVEQKTTAINVEACKSHEEPSAAPILISPYNKKKIVNILFEKDALIKYDIDQEFAKFDL